MRDFRELDQLRLSDPAEAGRRAEALLRGEQDLSDYEMARLCAVYGSSLRATSRLDEAEEVLREGSNYAERLGDQPLVQADLFQRHAIVKAESGNLDQAEWICLRAAHAYMLAGDNAGLGRCLVDTSKWQFEKERYNAALVSLKRALDLLPEDEAMNRYAALLGCGFVYRALGDLPSALDVLDQAAVYRRGVGETLEASRHGLVGDISLALGRYAEAEDAFRWMFNFYVSREIWIEAVCTAIELVTALIAQRNARKVLALSSEVRCLIAPLRKNSRMQKCAIELACYCSDISSISPQRLRNLSRVARSIADAA